MDGAAIRGVVMRASRQIIKVGLTVGAFYLLLTHSIDDGEGGSVQVGQALKEHLRTLDMGVFVPYVAAAAGIKMLGIASSMFRWHLLLVAQGIRFNFWHIAGSFLIGRFLGTFLPSTVGLDSYKLYDAARFSKRPIEVAAATAVEKVMGLSGIFLTFLVTLPLGISILGDQALWVLAWTLPVAVCVLAGLFALLFYPQWVSKILGQRFLGTEPAAESAEAKSAAAKTETRSVKLQRWIGRTIRAASAYRGKGGLLASVMGLSFCVHFTTAAMYFFTALAVGASGAGFWEVSFASSIQILATVLSPFTIAGEGIREIVQAFLLEHRIGTVDAVLSAALGFWAAEAMTLFGAFFWWGRRSNYRPQSMVVADALAAGS